MSTVAQVGTLYDNLNDVAWRVRARLSYGVQIVIVPDNGSISTYGVAQALSLTADEQVRTYDKLATEQDIEDNLHAGASAACGAVNS